MPREQIILFYKNKYSIFCIRLLKVTMYNKVNVKRHQEARKCLNCGKEWSIWVKKDTISNKINFLCPECYKKLSSWQRKKNKNG